MDATEFVGKWGKVELTEKQAAHQHFLDLCELLDLRKRADAMGKLDAAVFEADEWPPALSDEEILNKLPTINMNMSIV